MLLNLQEKDKGENPSPASGRCSKNQSVRDHKAFISFLGVWLIIETSVTQLYHWPSPKFSSKIMSLFQCLNPCLFINTILLGFRDVILSVLLSVEPIGLLHRPTAGHWVSQVFFLGPKLCTSMKRYKPYHASRFQTETQRILGKWYA